MHNNLEHIPASAGSVAVGQALERDGACIVEDALTSDQLAGLNQDLEAQIALTTPETRTPDR